LDHDDFVAFPAFVQLGEQFRQVVVADRRRRGRQRRGLPERHLLQPDQVGLLGEQLLRQALGPGREVVVDDFAQDLTVGRGQLLRGRRRDRGSQVGPEVEVAGHHVDLLAAPVVAGVAMSWMAVARVAVVAVSVMTGVAMAMTVALMAVRLVNLRRGTALGLAVGAGEGR
jgi:hypothetical protein